MIPTKKQGSALVFIEWRALFEIMQMTDKRKKKIEGRENKIEQNEGDEISRVEKKEQQTLDGDVKETAKQVNTILC